MVSGQARSPDNDYVESFYLFERERVEAMLTGAPVTQTGAENLKALTIAFAAYRAGEQGTVVITDL